MREALQKRDHRGHVHGGIVSPVVAAARWESPGLRKKIKKVRDSERKCLTISDIIVMISDMKTTPIERKIEHLKQQLAELGPIHPGSLSEQYNVCGKPDGRCKDPQHPQRHE